MDMPGCGACRECVQRFDPIRKTIQPTDHFARLYHLSRRHLPWRYCLTRKRIVYVLACQSEIWKKQGERSKWAGNFYINSAGCYMGNFYTGGCSCPAGYATGYIYGLTLDSGPYYLYSCYLP